MNLTISGSLLSVVKWWVDASYNTHYNYKGNTEAMMTL